MFFNETPYPAIHFEALDQHCQVFDAFVLKLAFRVEGPGSLVEDDPPKALLCEDEPFGEMHRSSIRMESDLAPFKPLCDVIVNAEAHAPSGRPSSTFIAGLRMRGPESSRPMPAEPQGLNPFMAPSESAITQYHQAVAQAKASPLAGELFIDKRLRVHGPRMLRKKLLPVRLFWGLMRVVTLGLIRRNPWKLTRPQKSLTVPLRYEASYGGMPEVRASSPNLKAVPKKSWEPDVDLNALKTAFVSSGDDGLLARSLCSSNPIGCGHAPLWHLKATETERLNAPQIEHPAHPFTAKSFWKAARGKLAPADPTLTPHGLGIVGRAWSPRVERVGHFPEGLTWAEDEYPLLPDDFDFRHWNAAPDDQQVPYPIGGESIELINLCTPDAPWAERIADGDTLLRFRVPELRPWLLVEDELTRMAALPFNLDTIVVDATEGKVQLTYRAIANREAGLASARLQIQRPGDPDALGSWQQILRETEASHG